MPIRSASPDNPEGVLHRLPIPPTNRRAATTCQPTAPPDNPAGDPDRGSVLHSPAVEARSAEDPGITCNLSNINDPDRVSLPPTIAITSDTLAGSGDKPNHRKPGVVGATPLRHSGYEKCTPIGVPPLSTDPAGDPGRGPFCLARVSRHEVPKTPGFLRSTFMTRPRQGVAPSGDLHYKRHAWRMRRQEGA